MTTNRKHPSGERGFTVIEILVATSIFAIIMIAALLIYDRSNKVFKLGVEAADVQQNTRIAFDKLVADLRMTGFDFDRDGIPSSTGGVTSFQQPDEQIEYISDAAVTIRGNFDYNDRPTIDDNGREWDTTTTAGPGKSGLESDQFPVVTTGNDEIVTYALVSTDASKNTDSITFFADVPSRASFPGSGGRTENLVTISGVDLSNANPPYTLERITLNPSTSSVTPLSRFPIATNIRSLTFEYFEDQAGTVGLKDLANADIAPANYDSAVGGLGQFDPNAASVVAERAIRGKIQSVKLVLTGMNEAPDFAYTDTADTVAPKFRKYRLETLVVPRNTGRRGMREQEFTEPNAPTITQVCIGYCGVAWVVWDAPVGGGSVEDYKIAWDTLSTGTFADFRQVGVTTQYFVDGLDPLEEYYFKVTAINSYGSSPSNNYPASGSGLSVKNATKPEAPDDASVTVSGGSNAGDPLPTANRIDLQWEAPDDPTAVTGTISCSPSGTASSEIPIAEFAGWRVKRSLSSGFNPDTQGQAVLTEATAFPPDPITRIVNFPDRAPESAFPPANCFNYYYRIRTQEVCNTGASNTSGNAADGNSDWTANEYLGRAESNIQPSPVVDLSFDAASACAAGTCNVTLTWPKVITDVGGASVFIGNYFVDRKRYDATDLSTPLSSVNNIRVDLNDTNAVFYGDPLRVTWNDPGDATHGAPLLEFETDAFGVTTYYVYEYTVRAQQCGSPDGGTSPARRFPCAFTDPVSVTLSETPIEGDGLSPGSAWLLDNSVSVTVDTAGFTMASFEATMYIGATPTPLAAIGASTNVAVATFGIPDVADGVPVTVEFAVTNLTGCRRVETRYFEQTATNCCLTPLSIDSTVAIAGAQEVRIVLKNTCAEDLAINSVEIEWDSTKAQNGTKFDDLLFPSATGTCPTLAANVNSGSETPPPIAAPGGAGVVATGSGSTGIACGSPGSNEYRLIATFSKGFTTADQTGPITQVCVNYTRSSTGATVTQCQIIPGPSAVAGVCD